MREIRERVEKKYEGDHLQSEIIVSEETFRPNMIIDSEIPYEEDGY